MGSDQQVVKKDLCSQTQVSQVYLKEQSGLHTVCREGVPCFIFSSVIKNSSALI